LKLRFSLVAAVLLLLTPQLWSRGKNKIPAEDFDWEIYQSDHFKIYFYPEAKALLPKMVRVAESSYKTVSDKLQHEINFLIPVIYYKTHEEFNTTHVFEGFLPRNVEAFTEPFQSRMVLPADMPDSELFALFCHELVHVFQYDMLYNNRISTIIRAGTPTWFTEGMASYIADDETNLDRMALRDVAVNGGLFSLGGAGAGGLSFLTYRIGHAAFDFIESKYGIEGVRNFIWQYRKNVTGSLGSAIQRAFDVTVEDFDRDFRKYLRKRYIDLLPVKEEPDDYAREIRTRQTFTTISPKLSPSGDLFAAIIPYKNDIDLVLISTKDGRIFKNLTRGYTNRYTQISVGAFQGVTDLGWSPDGNRIAFSAREENAARLFVINVLRGRIIKEIAIDDIRDLQAPAFSADGESLFFVGNRNGQYDVFRYDLAGDRVANLTNDPYHDRNPSVSPDGKEILYSSNRSGFYKIFDLTLATGEKRQLTSGIGNDIQPTFSADQKRVFYSSDRYDDIYNIFSLDLESGQKHMYTNILTGAFAPQERVLFDHKEGVERKQLLFTAYYQGRFRVYRMDKPEERRKAYDVEDDNYENIKDYQIADNIELDPRRFTDYKIKNNFSVSGANVTVGATDDGRFLSNAVLQLSDTVGNHRLDISTYSVSSYENYFLNYLNRSRRLQWGAQFSSVQEFFLDSFINPFADRQERAYKFSDLAGYIRYPFSFNSRIDFGAGYTDNDFFTFVRDVEGELELAEADYTVPFAYLAYSWDSARYKSYGPQHGKLLDLTYRNEFGENQSASMDLRLYQELTRRSLLAFRTIADISDGETPRFYALGGNNYLRGDFRYREFVGTRRLLTQLEIRFPLIDRLQFPGGVAFGNIRGALFVEAGGAWFEEDDFGFDFQFEFQDSLPPELQALVDSGVPREVVDPDNIYWNPDNPNTNYLIGAYGAEIIFNFFGLDLHWTWSRRTNFDDFPTNSRMSFWIGTQF